MSAAPSCTDPFLVAAEKYCMSSQTLRRTAVDIQALLRRDISRVSQPSRSVLLVHDNEGILWGLQEALLSVAPVHSAATVHEARVILRRHAPAVIVTDYGLGNDSATDFLRERSPAFRAVLISAQLEIGDLKPLARGVGALLMETPSTPEEIQNLCNKVRTILNEVFA